MKESELCCLSFGHLGDGNIHYNIIMIGNRKNFKTLENKVYETVNNNVKKQNGSISTNTVLVY